MLHCYDHTFDHAVVRELALVKVAVGANERTEALQIAAHFGCRTEDLTEESMIVMATGATEKIDALISMLRKFSMIEMVPHRQSSNDPRRGLHLNLYASSVGRV